MTQNLRIAPGTPMTVNDTNITPNYTSSNPYILPDAGYDLKNDSAIGENCYGDYSNGVYIGNGWSNACTHLPDVSDISTTNSTPTQIGAWYNYAAASASTIATPSDNTTEDVYNICPKNWTLPTQTQTKTLLNDQVPLFNSIRSGDFINGELRNPTSTFWWTSTAANNYSRYGLQYYDSYFNGSSYGSRRTGFTIRCIRTT